VCDDVLPLSVSFFDLPPRNLIPRHSKVLLFTSGDDVAFTFRTPLALPPSCILCINTIIDTTPALLPHKQRMKSVIMAAYEQSSSINAALVLKASVDHFSARAETLRESALDAAYVLVFLAFGCEVMSQSCTERIFIHVNGLPLILLFSRSRQMRETPSKSSSAHALTTRLRGKTKSCSENSIRT
jgi:hypothetical protein